MDHLKSGDWAPLSALPETGPEEDAAPTMRLSCNGETFELRPERSGGTHYTWLSGPNPGYGFTMSPILGGTGVEMSSREGRDIEQHQTNIQKFLSMIDPETGYIAEH
jgi:hypothetical protein